MADAVSGIDPILQVLHEIHEGQGQGLAATGRQFPSHKGPGTVDPSTIFRWITKGIRASDGRLVKLEAVRVGARWLTSQGAVARFIEALTAAATPPPLPPIRTPAARTKAAAQAEAKLRAMGA